MSSVDPVDAVEVAPVAAGKLDGQLCLADAAHSLHDLGDEGGTSPVVEQGTGQGLERLGAAGEEGVTVEGEAGTGRKGDGCRFGKGVGVGRRWWGIGRWGLARRLDDLVAEYDVAVLDSQNPASLNRALEAAEKSVRQTFYSDQKSLSTLVKVLLKAGRVALAESFLDHALILAPAELTLHELKREIASRRCVSNGN